VFNDQLNALTNELSKTHQNWIRCLKPNDLKLPYYIDSVHLFRQIECSGILETVKIRQQGYPFRLDRFAVLELFYSLITQEEKMIIKHNLENNFLKYSK